MLYDSSAGPKHCTLASQGCFSWEAIRRLELQNPFICRVSSAVEQRFCKPLVGSSILSPGTAFPPDVRAILERTEPDQ